MGASPNVFHEQNSYVVRAQISPMSPQSSNKISPMSSQSSNKISPISSQSSNHILPALRSPNKNSPRSSSNTMNGSYVPAEKPGLMNGTSEESFPNYGRITNSAADESLDKSEHRNTFEGMDFDFNELTSSQQDLTIKHREIVAERKLEQEQQRLERQRLDDILNMCAEYEKQIQREQITKETKSPQHKFVQPPSLFEINSDGGGSVDRKEYKNSSKIKTNGSLNLLASPTYAQRDGALFSFQMRRCGSNSSNSEEETCGNSEDTGTIKRRPNGENALNNVQRNAVENNNNNKIFQTDANSPSFVTSTYLNISNSTTVKSPDPKQNNSNVGLFKSSEFSRISNKSESVNVTPKIPENLHVSASCNVSQMNGDIDAQSTSSSNTLKDESRHSSGELKLRSGSQTPITSESDHSLEELQSQETAPSSSGVETSSENSLNNEEVSMCSYLMLPTM